MSSNNESNLFEKANAIVTGIPLIASGMAAPLSPDMQTQQPNYSIVTEQESDAQKWYSSLPEISKTPAFEKQLETMAEVSASGQREKTDKELETSLNAETMGQSSGSPDPDSEPESEEGEYESEYMKDLQSRLEAGTLTLKSPEDRSQSELTESESESRESDTESESESNSEINWG